MKYPDLFSMTKVKKKKKKKKKKKQIHFKMSSDAFVIGA